MTALLTKQIKRLYYEDELSIAEISERLQKSPKSISRIMRENGLDCRTKSEDNDIRYKKQPASYSIKKKLSAKEERLKIAGIMLYWTEGAKPNAGGRNWTVDLANSDSRMIELFLHFLRIICGVDEKRLRVYMYCYANQNVDYLKKYWHNVTGVPLEQFTKPYVRQDFLPEKIGKMPYGLVHIRYNDKKLLSQIMTWIEEYLENV